MGSGGLNPKVYDGSYGNREGLVRDLLVNLKKGSNPSTFIESRLEIIFESTNLCQIPKLCNEAKNLVTYKNGL